MPEYGVFNDEGCIDSQYVTFEQADAVAADFRRQGDESAKASEICPDHEEQPAASCEECFAEGCVDVNGDEWPEHDYGETECRRCGAEPEES